MTKYAAAICVCLSLAGVSSAATISGSVGVYAAYSVFDLSTGASDWAAYGGLGVDSDVATDFTSKTASSTFSALTIDGTPYTQSLNGYIKFRHEAGVGTYPAAVLAPSSIDSYPVIADSGSLSQISFTHTMQGAGETMNVIVMGKTASQNVDITATCSSGGSWSWLAQALPVSGSQNRPQGIVALDISGASVGDVITFTIAGNYDGLSPASWWGIGVAGANSTVTAVPEPASMVLLGLGGIAVLLRRRRRA